MTPQVCHDLDTDAWYPDHEFDSKLYISPDKKIYLLEEICTRCNRKNLTKVEYFP